MQRASKIQASREPKIKMISSIIDQKYVVDTQKNHLIEMFWASWTHVKVMDKK